MKVKELDGNIDIGSIKVKIPNDIFLEKCMSCGLKSKKVYVISSWGSGVWVKEDLKSERIFPLQISAPSILEWDVV